MGQYYLVFQDKGTDVFFFCPGTKGQWDKLKILPWDGPGWDFDILPLDGLGQNTGQKEKREKKIQFLKQIFFYIFFLTMR